MCSGYAGSYFVESVVLCLDYQFLEINIGLTFKSEILNCLSSNYLPLMNYYLNSTYRIGNFLTISRLSFIGKVACLIVLFSGSILGQNITLPSLPDYPSPALELSVVGEKEVYFNSNTPVDFATIFIGGGDPTVVRAQLFMPENSDENSPVPAMVILHGSGGIREERELMYAKFLSENGIAAFVVDSFSARGITGETPDQLKALTVTEADLVADAYSALRILQTHSFIDPERIGVMGFSYGGIASRFCLDSRIYASLGSDLNPFAIHLDFYGPCYMDIQTKKTTGAPYLSFRGGNDQSNLLIECARIEQLLREAGSAVGTRVYSKAGHAWELNRRKGFIEIFNPGPCLLKVDELGRYVFGGKVFDGGGLFSQPDKIEIHRKVIEAMNRECIAPGYVAGSDKKVSNKVKNEVLDALKQELLKGLNRWEGVVRKSEYGMVVAAEPYAASVGLKVLENGGNAVDAAVAVGFALSVTYPEAGNLGGGGFLVYYDSESGESYAIDYREAAPIKASRDMFLNEAGEVDEDLIRLSYLSAGVPGTVSGLTLALREFGTLSLSDAIEPSIELAKNGFPVSQGLYYRLNHSWMKKRLLMSEAASKIFFDVNGNPLGIGELLIQKDLAWTLEQIANDGADAFYRGTISEILVNDMSLNGGIISLKDLDEYQAVIRKPLRMKFGDFEVISMPPPSSGGVHLLQMLNMIECVSVEPSSMNTVDRIHLFAEVMKRAYADRAQYLGDSDFYPVPVQTLISKKYAQERMLDFDPLNAASSELISPGVISIPGESDQTTHFSVVDKWGNAVSNTYTLNSGFGSKQMVNGAGFFLNNEMDDFSAKPGAPNSYGLVGGIANEIAPGKRMLSSMTPTIVIENDELRLVTGSPGGSKIITTVFQVVFNLMHEDIDVLSSAERLKVHHQWHPDKLLVERSMLLDVQINELRSRGHEVVEVWGIGNANTIYINDGSYWGVADPRGGGVAIGH